MSNFRDLFLDEQLQRHSCDLPEVICSVALVGNWYWNWKRSDAIIVWKRTTRHFIPEMACYIDLPNLPPSSKRHIVNTCSYLAYTHLSSLPWESFATQGSTPGQNTLYLEIVSLPSSLFSLACLLCHASATDSSTRGIHTDTSSLSIFFFSLFKRCLAF